MKMDEIPSLKIKSIYGEGDIDCCKYLKNSFVIEENGRNYMVVKLNSEKINNLERFDDLLKSNNNLFHGCLIKFEDAVKDLDIETVNWGSENDFIVDMNGIDNFIYAQAQVFNDSTIRKIMYSIGEIEPTKYLRFGASGARANEQHPGGEVVEYQIIDGKKRCGISKSVSGYLDLPYCEYSKSILMSENGNTMKEERMVYSHTAWLQETSGNKNGFTIILNSISEEQNVLNIICELIQESRIPACGVQIQIKCSKKDNVRIKGRVLKYMPTSAFEKLQEATDISIEKEFRLPKEATAYFMGTFYNRYEPEWEQFTNGRKYEKRGHYHGTILGSDDPEVHQTFHVRDIWIAPENEIKIEIYPIYTIYKIYSVYKKENKLYLDSNSKNVDVLLDEINMYFEKEQKNRIK